MRRRTQLQMLAHQQRVKDMMLHGTADRVIVQRLVAQLGLTPRQVRYDIARVDKNYRGEDEEIAQGKRASRDLALAADRSERNLEKALDDNDPRRAETVERERSKMLGLYPAQRKKRGFTPLEERQQIEREVLSEVHVMYCQAPRNPDGSVVLTAFSRSRPPVEDDDYREQIENPRGRKISRKRQDRIDMLRETLADGTPLDELEAVAAERFGLSARQIRRDMRLLMRQLDEAGERLLQGTHPRRQSVALAADRREAIRAMALKAGDKKLAGAIEADRAKLLGLYPADRPVREPEPNDLDRVFEVELAKLDADAGHRHTVAELVSAADGRPGVSGRLSWQPAKDIVPDYQQQPIDWDPADYRGDDLPDDYGDPNKRPEGIDPFS